MGLEAIKLIVTGCSNCPLYYYNLDEECRITSKCKHPIPIENINRKYQEGKGILPVTPDNCPLNEKELIIAKWE